MTDDNNDSHGAKSPFGQRREPPEADLTGSPTKGKRGRRSRLWAVLKWTGVAMLVLLIGALVVAASADQADRAAPQRPAVSGSA